MDRYKLALLLLCILTLSADAHIQRQHRAVLSLNRGAAAGPSYLLTEGFEGTGYDETTANTWVEGGTPDEDASNAGFGMEGSQALFVNSNSERIDINFTANQEVWAYFQVRFTNSATQTTFWGLDAGGTPTGGTAVCNLRYNADGTIRITAGTVNATSTGTHALDTTYHVWVRCKRDVGNGSNGIAELYTSTTTTKPGSPDPTAITTGTTDDDISSVALLTTAGTNRVYFDKLRIDDAPIGSNPS